MVLEARRGKTRRGGGLKSGAEMMTPAARAAVSRRRSRGLDAIHGEGHHSPGPEAENVM